MTVKRDPCLSLLIYSCYYIDSIVDQIGPSSAYQPTTDWLKQINDHTFNADKFRKTKRRLCAKHTADTMLNYFP